MLKAEVILGKNSKNMNTGSNLTYVGDIPEELVIAGIKTSTIMEYANMGVFEKQMYKFNLGGISVLY
jgi:hypothetical protein